MKTYGANPKERENWKPTHKEPRDPLTIERNRIHKSLQVILHDRIKEHWWNNINYAIYEEEPRN